MMVQPSPVPPVRSSTGRRRNNFVAVYTERSAEGGFNRETPKLGSTCTLHRETCWEPTEKVLRRLLLCRASGHIPVERPVYRRFTKHIRCSGLTRTALHACNDRKRWEVKEA
jgi:hypothetical protein